MSPCAGSTHDDMPFSVLGKHTPFSLATESSSLSLENEIAFQYGSARRLMSNGSDSDIVVQGLEYLTLELYDDNDDMYLLFMSSSFAAYMDASQAIDSLYDSNMANAISLMPGSSTQIGNMFKLFFEASGSKITAVLTINGSCTLHWYIQGEVSVNGM